MARVSIEQIILNYFFIIIKNILYKWFFYLKAQIAILIDFDTFLNAHRLVLTPIGYHAMELYIIFFLVLYKTLMVLTFLGKVHLYFYPH